VADAITCRVTMDKLDPVNPPPSEDEAASDLARRLARYRRRVAAEDRPRSVKVIDRAINDADGKPKRDQR